MRMTEHFSAIGVVVAVLAGPQAAEAAVEVNDHITINDWAARPDFQSQGPLYVEIFDGQENLKVAYLSFCLERRESFTSGKTYNIAGVGSQTVRSGKTLTGYTAWVYERFLDLVDAYDWDETKGPTTSFPNDPKPNHVDFSWGYIMDLYQKAIWAGMVGPDYTVGSSYAEFQITGWTDYAAIGISLEDFDKSTWAGGGALADQLAYTGNYRVINIAGGVQDQLYFLIPEPGSLAIWSLVGGIAAARAAARRLGRRRTRWSDENRRAIFSVVGGL